MSLYGRLACTRPGYPLNSISKYKDSEYTWKYNIDKPLADQKLNEYTLPVLAYLNGEYLLNKDQKELIEKFYVKNDGEKKPETEQQNDMLTSVNTFVQQNSVSNLTNNEAKNEENVVKKEIPVAEEVVEENVSAQREENTQLLDVSKEKWYKKVWHKIVGFFKRK